jgi:formylglycine-generating enzyme required for sulfatase activity
MVFRPGQDHALFFAVNDYRAYPEFLDLSNPISSAKAIATELRDMYAFKTEVVENPTKDRIYEVLQRYRSKNFGPNDQLFVFFSGHGDFDDFEVKGFFIPKTGRRIDLTSLGNIIAKIPCKHTLLAIDACYSGTIDQKIAFMGRFNRPGVTLDTERQNLIDRKLRNRSRLLLTSGTKQRTPGGTNGSPFANGILKSLKAGYGSEDGLVTYEDMISKLERVSPLPYHGKLPGHDEGSFVFVANTFVVPTPAPSPRRESVTTRTPVRPNPSPPDNMVFISGGTFQMGDQFGDGDSDEKPVHAVTISDFYMSRTELTFAEYDRFCKATGRDLPDDEGWARDQRPVVNVNWLDAVAYCNWWSEQSGYTPVYRISGDEVTANWNADGYRLPTEAEWEYAARSGGKKHRFGNGQNTISPTNANFDASASYKKDYSVAGEYRKETVPVGSFLSNNLGLADMSGNVWEWCWDWKDSGYYGKSPANNPRGPDSGTYRVLRGGSWVIHPVNCRAANRNTFIPSGRSYDIGFSLARSL